MAGLSGQGGSGAAAAKRGRPQSASQGSSGGAGVGVNPGGDAGAAAPSASVDQSAGDVAPVAAVGGFATPLAPAGMFAGDGSGMGIMPGMPMVPGHVDMSALAQGNLGGHMAMSGDLAEGRDGLEEVLGQQFPCVRVHGVPMDVHCQEILMFFNGLTILDVVFADRPGDAIVLFGSMMEVNLARARSGSPIRHRFVEIVPASRKEYYDAVVSHLKQSEQGQMQMQAPGHVGPGPVNGQLLAGDMGPPGHHPSGPGAQGGHKSGQGQRQGGGRPSGGRRGGRGQGGGSGGGGGGQQRPHTGTLRLRGLPFSASAEDIVKFFGDFNLSQDDIKFVMRSDGKVTGEAYVTFASADDARSAMVMDRQSIGSRYIELFASSPQEAARAR